MIVHSQETPTPLKLPQEKPASRKPNSFISTATFLFFFFFEWLLIKNFKTKASKGHCNYPPGRNNDEEYFSLPFIFIESNNSHYINLFKSFLISILSVAGVGWWSLGERKKLIFVNFSFCNSPQSFTLPNFYSSTTTTPGECDSTRARCHSYRGIIWRPWIASCLSTFLNTLRQSRGFTWSESARDLVPLFYTISASIQRFCLHSCQSCSSHSDNKWLLNDVCFKDFIIPAVSHKRTTKTTAGRHSIWLRSQVRIVGG